MLRSSMKKQEKLLESHGFVRCHRSFIVNFAKVALLRKDKDGPYLDLPFICRRTVLALSRK